MRSTSVVMRRPSVLFQPVGVLAGGVVGGASGLLQGAEHVASGVASRVTGLLNHAQDKLPHAVTDTEVVEPTPENRWFTPMNGWPCDDGNEHATPHHLMPTAKDAAPLFESEDKAIGELRVEVLEAENLPNMDAVSGMSLGNKTDAYALLLFEGFAAQTSVVFDSLNPRWGGTDPKSFRAFRFPVMAPYSVLYVCMVDYDGTKANAPSSSKGSFKIDGDDPIGRIAIQLGRLTASTQYDCWFQLGYGAIEKPNGKLGSVRLRFSVTFKSERRRILSYLKDPPLPVIPLNKKRYRKIAAFAKHGKLADESYNWAVLMVYVDELKANLKSAISVLAGLESWLLWRKRYIPCSMASCVAYQVIISYPHLIPSACCVMALVFLHMTCADPRMCTSRESFRDHERSFPHLRMYRHSDSSASGVRRYHLLNDDLRIEHPIHRRPSLTQLLAALLFNTRPPPLPGWPAAASSSTADSQTRPSETFEDKDASSRSTTLHQVGEQPWTIHGAYEIIELVSRDVRESAERYWHEIIFGFDDDGDASEELRKERAKVEAQVAEFIDDGNDSVEEKIVKRQAMVTVQEKSHVNVVGHIAAAINPLAAFLGPVQKVLAKVVVQ